MNAPNTPSTSDAAGDAFDRLMCDYFRKEMPATFPPLPLTSIMPTRESMMKRRSFAVLRSRIVLAVSVLVVAIGCWFAIGQRTESPVRPSTGMGGSVGEKKDPFSRPGNSKSTSTSSTDRK